MSMNTNQVAPPAKNCSLSWSESNKLICSGIRSMLSCPSYTDIRSEPE